MVRAGCVFVAGIHPSRTWTSGSFEVRAMKCMCAQTRPRFILSSERVFWGNGVWTHVNSKGKIPSTGKFPQTRIEPCGQRAQALPTELFRPRLSSSLTFLQTGQLRKIGRPKFSKHGRQLSRSYFFRKKITQDVWQSGHYFSDFSNHCTANRSWHPHQLAPVVKKTKLRSTFYKDATFSKLQEKMCGLSALPWRPNSTAANRSWRRRLHSSPERPWSCSPRTPRRRRKTEMMRPGSDARVSHTASECVSTRPWKQSHVT